ncbi:ABC transporter ATP-binding protein [Actinophytocola sp.]|uniref:ABC transporter ATP-binding protein n=1 Tax=Actinophytocola sp. TaxID=1872138 RepID=UPI003D6BEC31
MLSMVDLNVRYPPAAGGSDRVTHALYDVSLDIDTGSFVAIVGPSGCGKTTLLNVVAGLVKPSSGTAVLDGERITGPGASRAVVFQHASLFPWRTVLDNVVFGAEVQRLGNRRQRKEKARALIEMVGLSGTENKRPFQLSGGMRQRINLARALMLEPQVLLMDEPFASLDAHTRRLMQEELLGIWERVKATTLFITHDISEALYLADTVYVMSPSPGRIIGRLDISLDRPRPEDARTDTRMAQWERRIDHAIRSGGRADADEHAIDATHV